MSKSIKEQIRDAELELLELQISKARKNVKKLQKREVIRNARGEIVKSIVKDVLGRPVNRTPDDTDD